MSEQRDEKSRPTVTMLGGADAPSCEGDHCALPQPVQETRLIWEN